MDEASHDYPTDEMSARRRISRLLTGGDWMARILIESLLVVFSILVALGVNEWQNTRAQEELATKSLIAFQREIRQNKARLEESAPIWLGLREVITRMNEAGEFRTAQQFHQFVGVEPLRPTFITSTVWETSVTTGALPSIPFDIVNALSFTYSQQESLIEFGRSNMPTLARGNSVPDDQIRNAVREVVIYMSEMSRSENELLAAYDEVLRILDTAIPADSTAVTSAFPARTAGVAKSA